MAVAGTERRGTRGTSRTGGRIGARRRGRGITRLVRLERRRLACSVHPAWKGSVAVLLVVTMGACSSTTRVRLPSPELSQMNLRAHDTRSTVTLRDGRQLEVDGLRVNVEEATGSLVRQRTVDAQYEATSPWDLPDVGEQDLSVPSVSIARVSMRTDRGKGSAIGAAAGLVGGTGAGAGIGYGIAAAAADSCSRTVVVNGLPYSVYDPECASNNDLGKTGTTVLGAIIGAVVFGVVGYFVGRRGVERTYEFDVEPDRARPVSPSAAATVSDAWVQP